MVPKSLSKICLGEEEAVKKIGVLVLGVVLMLGMSGECKGSVQKNQEIENQNLKDMVERELGGTFQDEEWKLVDGSSSHTGSLDLSKTVNCYKDGDKIFVLCYSGSGMSQYYWDEIYSIDGGETWERALLHGVSDRTALYFVNNGIIMADGIGMFTFPEVKYCTWTGAFINIEIDEIARIKELPFMNGFMDISFSNLDAKKNQITLQWYPLYGKESTCFYKMVLDLESMETVSADDPYGLLEMTEELNVYEADTDLQAKKKSEVEKVRE